MRQLRVILFLFFTILCSGYVLPLFPSYQRNTREDLKNPVRDYRSFSISSNKEGKISEDNEIPPMKGFGKPKPKPNTSQQSTKDIGTITYENQAQRGVPEYNIFLRPSNGSDVEWIPVGSMTIPRDTSISKAIYEVEEELLKGTFKIYPQMKKFYEEKKIQRLGDYERAAIFEYGYCLKAYPDEPIILIRKEPNDAKSKQNFFTDW